MPSSAGSFALVGAVAVAALVAAFRTQHPPATPVAAEPIQRDRSFEPPFDPANEETEDGVLPPNHPPVGPGDARHGALGSGQEGDQKQAIVWKVPGRWTSMPNPNAMRLATYRIKPSGGGADEAELSVVRAGGSTEANIERWVGQFTDAGPEKRARRTVHGLKITTVEESGTFQAGGMTADNTPTAPRKGWTLRGAVVETDEGLYFFKMTGPSALMKAARSEFDALIGSISPVRGTSL